jgi:hypothetical protein
VEHKRWAIETDRQTGHLNLAERRTSERGVDTGCRRKRHEVTKRSYVEAFSCVIRLATLGEEIDSPAFRQI